MSQKVKDDADDYDDVVMMMKKRRVAWTNLDFRFGVCAQSRVSRAGRKSPEAVRRTEERQVPSYSYKDWLTVTW
jgi:hypothetical protein